MKFLIPNDCLTAILIGLHFSKSRFSLGNFFNEILDAVSDLSDFEIKSKDNDEIVFKIGKVKISLNARALIINSQIVVNENLAENLPTREDEDKGKLIQLPGVIYGEKFELDQTLSIYKGDVKKFKRNFLSESIEIVKIIDKIVLGLPSFLFIGIVEYYAIPLNKVKWDILERFEEEASIPNWKNTEKRAINRYYVKSEKENEEKCLIFYLTKPNEYKDPNMVVGGARFDFQYLPEKPKSIAEYGGPEIMINYLASGIENVIKESNFMKFNIRNG